MKKTERLIAAITTIALGILLIVLKGTTVQINTSIFGVLLLVLGVLDLIAKTKNNAEFVAMVKKIKFL